MLPAAVRQLGHLALASLPLGILAAVLATHHRRDREHSEADRDQPPEAPDVAAPAPCPLAQLWRHAERGDARAVRDHLAEHDIPPDTPRARPYTPTHLVLDVARIVAFSSRLDSDLAWVLRELAAAGWNLDVREPGGPETGLSVLTQQERRYRGSCTYYRRIAFITASGGNPAGDAL